MTIREQIKKYITDQPEPKRSEIQTLHQRIVRTLPRCKLWFNDGKNSDGKTVTNPGIGYGVYTISYADGSTREFYQIGLSANTKRHICLRSRHQRQNLLSQNFRQKTWKGKPNRVLHQIQKDR